jgi:hypothetical protein
VHATMRQCGTVHASLSHNTATSAAVGAQWDALATCAVVHVTAWPDRLYCGHPLLQLLNALSSAFERTELKGEVERIYQVRTVGRCYS